MRTSAGEMEKVQVPSMYPVATYFSRCLPIHLLHFALHSSSLSPSPPPPLDIYSLCLCVSQCRFDHLLIRHHHTYTHSRKSSKNIDNN